jgi:hypothetical protein
MSRKKENIVSLGWHNVICPLAKAADPLSWILFVGFLALVAISIVARYDDGALHNFYQIRYPLFWYGAWILVVLATAGPIFNLTREKNEVPLGVLIGVSVAHVLNFLIISVVTLNQSGNVAAITALLAATVAASMVGIGWVVQHQSSARASRRAHTFNILMQSRLSKEFQDQIKKRADMYSAGNPVAAEDAKLFNKIGYEQCKAETIRQRDLDLARTKDEAKADVSAAYEKKLEVLEKKFESLQGVKYLLNFYEFMSAGIHLRELDEPLLRETLRDIAITLYKDSAQIRTFQRESQPNVFVNLDRIVKGIWMKDDQR